MHSSLDKQDATSPTANGEISAIGNKCALRQIQSVPPRTLP